MTSVLLAITLLSLAVAGLALAIAWRISTSARVSVDAAQTIVARYAERMNDAYADAAKWREELESAREQLFAAERRARSRESKYSRRQPETPAPLPENADA